MNTNNPTAPENSEGLETDIAALLLRANLQDGEYRKFDRPRPRTEAPSTQATIAAQIESAANKSSNKVDDLVAVASSPASSHVSNLASPAVLANSGTDKPAAAPATGSALHALRASVRHTLNTSSGDGQRGIGFFSLVGGVGRTSLAANIASALSQMGEHVVLVDSSEAGSLEYFFGAHEHKAGLRTFVAPQKRQPPLQLIAPEKLSPEWFSKDVAAAMAGAERTILDLACMSSDTLRGALSLCSHVFVPLLADVRCIRALHGTDDLLKQYGRPDLEVHYLLNNVDDSPFAQKVRELIERQLGSRLLEYAVERSPDVDQALAAGMSVADYAPHSKAARAYQQIARWIQAHIAVSAISSATAARWSEQ